MSRQFRSVREVVPERVARVIGILLFYLCISSAGAGELPRLALVPAEPGLAPAADFLTAEFSKNNSVEVLERAQIEKIYEEQAIATGQKDFLKLGQLLGADGILVLEIVGKNERKSLSLRLTAVKPGAVLQQRDYPWPLETMEGWSSLVMRQFQPVMPKLRVLSKDALPISILNLRSAVRSSEAEAMERQITLLLQNRLTQERDLFVLERRNLNQLEQEKELKRGEDAAFWNGSYLIEGAIDQSGYSKEMTTIDARLVPPGNAAPIKLRVSGPRTNLIVLADTLSREIMDKLRRRPGGSEWNPKQEAERYVEEATWAIKWKMFMEAQAAADAAWALGKRDLDCALVRVKSYAGVVPPITGGYQVGSFESQDFGSALEFIERLLERYPGRVGYLRRGSKVDYASVGKLPDPASIDRANVALMLYGDFAETLSANEPKMDSPWYLLGLETLEAASQVLEYFHFLPREVPPVAGKLAELRGRARSVAQWLYHWPSVRASYWVGDRLVSSDALSYLSQGRNIFSCTADWGCLWQDKPEETLALYRDLMSSPVFAYLNHRLWFRPLQRPRLAAWNEQDRLRIPAIWGGFLEEIARSTNVIVQLEGKFLALADAVTAKDALPGFEDAFGAILQNRGVIVSNNVDIVHFDWHLSQLVSSAGGSRVTPEKKILERRYHSEIRPQLTAMCEEHREAARQLAITRENAMAFEQQKRFLAELTAFEFTQYSRIFNFRDYSKAQAEELSRLVGPYRSNIVAASLNSTGPEKSLSRLAMNTLARLEERLKPVLEAQEASAPRPMSVISTILPGPGSPQPLGKQLTDFFGPAAQALNVNRFVKLPLEQLGKSNVANFVVFAHRWRDGWLWMDCRYEVIAPRGGHQGAYGAVIGWNPQKDEWDVVGYPNEDGLRNRFPVGFMGEPETRLHFEVFDGAVYLSDWEVMKKFDLGTRQWTTLKYPGQRLAQLFAVGKRLYAANDENIYEIVDGGQGTRVLASCRRRPVASTLDSLEHLGWATLFPGPEQRLGAMIGATLFNWDGRDWKEMMSLPDGKVQTFDDAVVVRSLPLHGNGKVMLLSRGAGAPELCWAEELEDPFSALPVAPDSRTRPVVPGATWSPPADLAIARSPVAVDGSNMYFYVEHSGITNVPTGLIPTEKDGRHANLVCMERGPKTMIAIPLRFDLGHGTLTSRAAARSDLGYSAKTWLVSTPDSLLIGQAGTPGIWVLPRNELSAAVASRKKTTQLSVAD